MTAKLVMAVVRMCRAIFGFRWFIVMKVAYYNVRQRGAYGQTTIFADALKI